MAVSEVVVWTGVVEEGVALPLGEVTLDTIVGRIRRGFSTFTVVEVVAVESARRGKLLEDGEALF